MMYYFIFHVSCHNVSYCYCYKEVNDDLIIILNLYVFKTLIFPICQALMCGSDV